MIVAKGAEFEKAAEPEGFHLGPRPWGDVAGEQSQGVGGLLLAQSAQ